MKKLLIVMAIVLGSLGFSTSILSAQATVENPKLTSEQAKEIALIQSKNGKFKEIELKHKNGVLVYEVEIAEGFMDREFLIDANTGEILRDKKDF